MNRFRGGFRRPANGGHPGASCRGHHGRQGTGYGVPPSGYRWSKAGANALLAVKCCLENRHRADFFERRACRITAA